MAKYFALLNTTGANKRRRVGDTSQLRPIRQAGLQTCHCHDPGAFVNGSWMVSSMSGVYSLKEARATLLRDGAPCIGALSSWAKMRANAASGTPPMAHK